MRIINTFVILIMFTLTDVKRKCEHILQNIFNHKISFKSFSIDMILEC